MATGDICINKNRFGVVGSVFLKKKRKMDIPDEILQEAEEANSKLLPEKSRSRYENELKAFNEWRTKNAVSMVLNETVMLAYVNSCKVVVVFGLYGACRRDELLKLTVDDIKDHEKYVLVNLQDTKTYTSRSFIIPDAQESLNPYDIYQKYAKLRPRHLGTRRFFLGYQHGKGIAQPAIGGVPRKVAESLGLDHPENYTGHCCRVFWKSSTSEANWWMEVF